MSFGFLTSTNKRLGQSDSPVRGGKISIKNQRLLVFCDALSHSVGLDVNGAKNMVSQGMVRSDRQYFTNGRLSGGEVSTPVIGEIAATNVKVDGRATVQCFKIAGIK